MKKYRIAALLICFLLALSACASPGGDTADASNVSDTSDVSGAETAEQIPVKEKPELVIMGQESSDYSRAAKTRKNDQAGGKTSALHAAKDLPKIANKDFTVMVYIVGSNLESRYGAATNDINEMIGAGLDYSRNNLLIYTGGSKRWTSDISNTYNSIINMENGEELEVAAQTSETADMGAADTLAEFINYCTANFPAGHYGLVLWDHGAGPLWGYGSDELYDNDSLLLEELRGAMDKTEFAGDKKLDFVGFDACLMGSIENAVLWKDYAQYLVGSEELESGRGWDYSFLSTLNETDDARTIVSAIVSAYENYYKENKSEFFNPDVTLAAMDLSKTDALVESANALFAAMDRGIEEGEYAQINRARARTKAFGLGAASGKEDAFDLLDLRDLAGNVMELYPEESRDVNEALDQLVVGSTSNVAGANGVSIYLPGDNMELYGISAELYSEEEALSEEYSNFVNSYMDSWIEGSNTDWAIAEIERGEGELTLQLTEEQIKNASQAYYTVLQRNSSGNFAIATANIAIEPDENGILHIPADPMLLHVATDMEEAPAPFTCVQAGRNGDECVYRTINCLLVAGHDFMDPNDAIDEDVVITVKNISGEEEAVIQDITSTNGSAWAGGKASVDVSNFESLINAGSISYQPIRDKEGRMEPFFEWKSAGYEMYPLSIDHGFRVLMKHASAFDKDFICQVTVKDINGNVHGSDYIELDLDHSRNYEAVQTEKGTLYADVSGDEAVITNYEGEDEIITVPSEIAGKKVTQIGDEAFRSRDCTKVILPQGLKTIGICAFRYSDVEEIEIPSSVEVIKRGAFSHTPLKSVSLPDGLKSIGSIPFAECENLSEIMSSDSNDACKTVDGVLYTKDGKELIQYPGGREGNYTVADGTEVIGYGAFAGSEVTDVVFPQSLKTIGNMAFFECDKLASFNLPDSLESVGTRAFGDFGYFSFYDEELPFIESVHIGPNLRWLGSGAFNLLNVAAFDVDENNPYFASSGGFITSKAKDMILEVPGGMGRIVVIPEGITMLQDYLFEGFEDGTEFVIPDSVFRFGTKTFPYHIGDEDEEGNYKYIFDVRLHCSEGSAAESYAKQYEIPYDDVMEPDKLVYETVTEDVPDADETGAVSMTFRVFGDHAELIGCSGEGVETLVIPDTFRGLDVTAIRYDFDTATSGLIGTHWDKVVIPESVSSVDTEFFASFYSMQEIETGDKNANYKTVDGVLFDKKGETLLLYPCSKKDAEYTVPDKTERIEEKAFYINRYIAKITFPKSLRTIGKNAFNGCSSLSAAEFGKGLKVIEDWAFNGCPLQNVKIPASVTSIGAAAFTVGEGFGRIELPEKLESLGYHAFSCYYNETFTQDSIRIPARLVIKNQYLDGILFDNYEVDEKSENHAAVEGLLMSKDGRTLVSVPTLKEGDLIIPEETLYIEYNALDGCDRITDIYLPDSILNLGNVGRKDYDTGEYYYTVHCRENTEAQRRLDAKGIPWEAW